MKNAANPNNKLSSGALLCCASNNKHSPRPRSLQQNYLGIPSVIKDNYSFTFALNIACPLNIYFGLFYGMSDRLAVSE